MKKFGLPQCPYCEKKINPFYAWYLRTQGEYICPACKGVSNISLSPVAKILGAGAVVAGILIFLAAILDQETDFPIFYVLWIMAPFVLFSILSAFCVQLKKPVLLKRRGPARPGAPAQGAQRPRSASPNGPTAVYQGQRKAQGAPGSPRPQGVVQPAARENQAPRQPLGAARSASQTPQGVRAGQAGPSSAGAQRPSAAQQAAPRVIRPGEAQGAQRPMQGGSGYASRAAVPAQRPAQRPAQQAAPRVIPPGEAQGTRQPSQGGSGYASRAEDDVWKTWDFDGRGEGK